MPFKNSAQWISQAIDSVQNQTYQNWTLYAIDDHSEDESAQIVASASHLDPRVILLHSDGFGIIQALKTGFSRVKEPMTTRLDSDDLMPPDRLMKMYKTLQDRGPGHLITGKVEYFSHLEKPVSPGYMNYAKWLNQRVDYNDFYTWRFRECVVASPAWMMHSDDLRKCGGFEGLQYPEDYHLVLRWLYQGIQFEGIPSLVLHWREHPMRTSRNHSGFTQKAFFDLKMKFLIDKEVSKDCHVFVATSKTPKARWTIAALKERHISFSTIDKTQLQSLPRASNSLLLSAVFPSEKPRAQLTSFVENLGYVHGVNFFFL